MKTKSLDKANDKIRRVFLEISGIPIAEDADPVEFILMSYAFMVFERGELKKEVTRLQDKFMDEIAAETEEFGAYRR